MICNLQTDFMICNLQNSIIVKFDLVCGIKLALNHEKSLLISGLIFWFLFFFKILIFLNLFLYLNNSLISIWITYAFATISIKVIMFDSYDFWEIRVNWRLIKVMPFMKITLGNLNFRFFDTTINLSSKFQQPQDPWQWLPSSRWSSMELTNSTCSNTKL